MADLRLPVNKMKIGDPNYRYWMHPIKVNEENGCSKISNLNDISQTLDYPEEILLQFISSQVSSKKLDPNILSGIYNEEKIQEIIYKFIDYYKLCPTCENPEMKPFLEKKKFIFNKCSGCGNIVKIEDIKYKSTFNCIKNFLNNKKWPESKGFLVEDKENENNDDDYF